MPSENLKKTLLTLFFSALVLLSLYSSLRAFLSLDIKRAFARGDDKVTVHLRRFDAAKNALAGVGAAGYTSDMSDGSYKKLAQYALPRTVLSEGTDSAFMLANFREKPETPPGFRAISSSGGVAVFQRIGK
jgi:hypothetical protein